MQSRESTILMDRNFTAAALDYAFDFARIAAEIHACREFFVDTPPYQRQVNAGLAGEIPFMSESEEHYRAIDTYSNVGIVRKQFTGAKIFYLRNSRESDVLTAPSFRITKNLDHGSWFWRPELQARIPYTIACIESLPYRTLGLVRAFVCDNTFMPTHRDTDPNGAGAGYDKTKAIGISLVPSTGNVGMLIWEDTKRRTREIRGNCLVFDDSKWHGVPMTDGCRITIRIFGDLDFDALRVRAAG